MPLAGALLSLMITVHTPIGLVHKHTHVPNLPCKLTEAVAPIGDFLWCVAGSVAFEPRVEVPVELGDQGVSGVRYLLLTPLPALLLYCCSSTYLC